MITEQLNLWGKKPQTFIFVFLSLVNGLIPIKGHSFLSKLKMPHY